MKEMLVAAWVVAARWPGPEGRSVNDSRKLESLVRTRPDRWGFWVAMLTWITGVVSFGVAVTTPPRSGPFCTSDCIGYPFTDAAFVPRDYLWMYPATLLLMLFVALAVVIHAHAPATRRVFTATGVLFATIAVIVLVLDYAIQLMVMQPSLLAGQAEGLSVFSQYNPHGVFIAMENVGYVSMAVAFVLLAPAFADPTRLDRILRWLLTVAGGLTVLLLVVMAIGFGADLEYRFEVAAISITWITLTVAAGLLSAWMRRGPSTRVQVP